MEWLIGLWHWAQAHETLVVLAVLLYIVSKQIERGFQWAERRFDDIEKRLEAREYSDD